MTWFIIACILAVILFGADSFGEVLSWGAVIFILAPLFLIIAFGLLAP